MTKETCKSNRINLFMLTTYVKQIYGCFNTFAYKKNSEKDSKNAVAKECAENVMVKENK